MIENWKDTAFGSDFGGDFLEFVQEISEEHITMDLIYENTDVKKYFINPRLLKERTDNNVEFTHSKFKQYVHFEDFIIGLSAMIVENELNAKIDLTKSYGSKVITFNSEKVEFGPVHKALTKIYNNPDNYVLFELLEGEYRTETLTDIHQILTEFDKLMEKLNS